MTWQRGQQSKLGQPPPQISLCTVALSGKSQPQQGSRPTSWHHQCGSYCLSDARSNAHFFVLLFNKDAVACLSFLIKLGIFSKVALLRPHCSRRPRVLCRGQAGSVPPRLHSYVGFWDHHLTKSSQTSLIGQVQVHVCRFSFAILF